MSVPVTGGLLSFAESTAVQARYASLGYEAVPHAEENNLAVTLRQYAYMVLKRKRLILGMVLAFVVLGGVRALLQPRLYSATVRIQIEREASKIVDAGAMPIESGGSDFLKTQFELLRSRAMADRVASAIHLGEDDSFFRSRDISVFGSLFSSKDELPAPADRQSSATGILISSLKILPVPGSRLVDLSVLDPIPARAQKIANAYADAYIASNLNKRVEANSYAKSFLADQVKQLKTQLEESEKALLDFSEQQKVFEVSDRASIAENNLAAANATTGQLITERIKNEELWRQVEHVTAINLPQFLSNPVIKMLRAQRKALETEYREKFESFKPSYPAMVQISSKMKEIDRQLAAEVKTIINSLKGAYKSSLAQENEMKAKIETLRAEVLDLQKKGIQYNILKREVDANRGLHNSLLQRMKEVDVASGVGTTNIFVIDRAMVPGFPSEPKVLLSLVISLALGLGVGVGVALLLELLDDRVRAPEEIERLSGLATLGIIPRVEEHESVAEALKDPRSAVSEAYRSLATVLQFSANPACRAR